MAELMKHIKGPDFPTGGGDRLAARRHQGDLRDRQRHSARCAPSTSVEDGDIVITALPHQVSGAKGAGADRAQMRNKKLPHGRRPARRIGSREPTRIVISRSQPASMSIS